MSFGGMRMTWRLEKKKLDYGTDGKEYEVYILTNGGRRVRVARDLERGVWFVDGRGRRLSKYTLDRVMEVIDKYDESRGDVK